MGKRKNAKSHKTKAHESKSTGTNQTPPIPKLKEVGGEDDDEGDNALTTTTTGSEFHLLEDLKVKRSLYQTRRAVFALGALLGLLITVFFTTNNQKSLSLELDKLVNFDSVSGFLDDWKDVLPTGIQSMISDFDMSSAAKEEGQLHGSADSFSVGRRMLVNYNLTSKYNVVMVPGVISTGLESWGLDNPNVETNSTTSECSSEPFFRKRLWGSFFMLRSMILDKACWLKHIMLDEETGLDPPGIKIRAAQGFEAADFFLAGYWIWNKILQNLAVIGYGPNNMVSASYDWRLAYLDLQKRDGYFTKLKQSIEMMKELNGQQTILVGHSMGSQVMFYFMKWAEAKGEFYGNGGPNWCNDHLAAYVDISGSSLGTPKAITALLSGEMKDTVQLNALAVYGLEKFFSRKERLDMLRTFGGIPSMLPKGGDTIWGNLTHAPDDPINTLSTDNEKIEKQDMENISSEKRKEDSFGTFIRFRPESYDVKNGEGHKDESPKNLTINDSIDFLLDQSPAWFSKRVKEQYSFGIAKTKSELAANDHDHSKWSNPLEARLPNAPNMKIFCFYGVGNPTERAYAYQRADKGSKLGYIIDTDSENPVYFGDGDGTVSLLTHSICHEWQKGSKSRFNPANSTVTIVEIKHEPDRFDIRGGAKTAEHVDILGSAELNELVLRVASGQGDSIENRYVSELQDIVSKIEI
ncbi:phospholipid:diacylglycerol acyltransferase [[Candida] anglica]|uniref:Phospholipid:diacylglycerol acyltransferase n=1 Tax=[Candida] anglica TaxID=148631 RepID=A0ABP0E5T2_9ASCO